MAIKSCAFIIGWLLISTVLEGSVRAGRQFFFHDGNFLLATRNAHNWRATLRKPPDSFTPNTWPAMRVWSHPEQKSIYPNYLWKQFPTKSFMEIEGELPSIETKPLPEEWFTYYLGKLYTIAGVTQQSILGEELFRLIPSGCDSSQNTNLLEHPSYCSLPFHLHQTPFCKVIAMTSRGRSGEDRIGITKLSAKIPNSPTHLVFVSDGHAGCGAVHYLQKNLANYFDSLTFAQLRDDQVVSKRYEAIDRDLEKVCNQSGTTLTAAFFNEKEVVVHNIGDSGARSVNGYTKGHSVFFATPEERSRVWKAGGSFSACGEYITDRTGFCRLAMTRALGDQRFKGKGSPIVLSHPEIRYGSWGPSGPYLLIVSDGFIEQFPLSLLTLPLGRKWDISHLEMAIHTAQDKTDDDITAVLIRPHS